MTTRLGRLALPAFLSLILGLRTALEFHSWVAGALTVVFMAVLLTSLIMRNHRKSERALSSTSEPPDVEGILQLSSLPADWRPAVDEALGIGAGQTDFVPARIFVDDRWLNIQSRSVYRPKHAFKARVPLTEVRVDVDEPWRGAIGSSLCFFLMSGYCLKLEVGAKISTAEQAAGRFNATIARAAARHPQPATAEVLSAPPKPRTAPGPALVMSLVVMVPWFFAMLSFADAPWAGSIASVVFFAGIFLRFIRPVRMAEYLFYGELAVGAAFLADYALASQPMSLAGLVAALAAAGFVGTKRRNSEAYTRAGSPKKVKSAPLLGSKASRAYNGRIQPKGASTLERSIALFFHIVGMAVLFAAIGVLQRGGARLRAASTIDEARIWLRHLGTSAKMFPAAFVIILVSGLYLTARLWTFSTPWIIVAIVSIIVMGGLGQGIAGKGLEAAGKASATASSLTPELKAAITNPKVWMASTASSMMAIGVIWLMVRKPAAGEAIVTVLVLGLAGAAIGKSKAK